MNVAALSIAVLLAGLVIGAWIAVVVQRRAQRLTLDAALASAGAQAQADLATMHARIEARDQEIQQWQARFEGAITEERATGAALHALQAREAVLEVQLQEERERAVRDLAMIVTARDELTAQFKALAGEALETNRQRMADQHRGALETILKPLGEKIVAFEKKVEETYDKEAQQRFSLRQEVLNLQAATLQINQDAVNLTLALKGEAKTRGNWGEVVLERVLERSGLVKGVEYRVQQTLHGEDGGMLRPDIVIVLPDNKHIVIDSKVSLVAYEGYHSAADDATRLQHGKRHVDSMRRHATGLFEKNYQGRKGLDSPDFVAMFVPIEPAFSLATSLEPEFFLDAWQQQVVIVTPSTLLALLMTVQTLWQRDKQTRNAIQIAEESGKLHDQFVLVIESLQDVGRKLAVVQRAFEETEKRLVYGKGNLVGRFKKLKDMGAHTKRQLPPELLERAGADDEAVEPVAPGTASKLTLVPDSGRDDGSA